MRWLINARNGAVGVDGATIVEPDGRFDLVLEMPMAQVRAGLINAHDHLHRNHYGRLGAPLYANACQWARDIQAHDAARIAEGRLLPRRDALLAGAWKNLLAGVTTVVHHDPWEPDFDTGFPLKVARVGAADSLEMTPGLEGWRAGPPFCLHLAEGVDAAAAREVHMLDEAGELTPDLIAVHGVGMDADGIARFRASGAALVWCPSSNLFLFDRTAPAELLSDGLDVLLGSDSLLTGVGDLLDELRCARHLALLSDERLEGAVGAVAARRFGLAAPSLDAGADADLVLLSRPLLEASAADVMLVMVGGAPRVVHPDLLPALGAALPAGRERTFGRLRRWTSDEPASPVGPRRQAA